MPKEEVIPLKELAPLDPYEHMSVFAIGLRTLVESIPFGLGPYGIGDAITLYEGIVGHMVMGPNLDSLNRVISIIAALIPVVPATPFRIFAIKIRKRLARQ